MFFLARGIVVVIEDLGCLTILDVVVDEGFGELVHFVAFASLAGQGNATAGALLLDILEVGQVVGTGHPEVDLMKLLEFRTIC